MTMQFSILYMPVFIIVETAVNVQSIAESGTKKGNRALLFTGGKIGHDYRGLLRVPHPALHSDGIVSADPEHSDPDMTGLGLSKTSFTDR